MTETTKTTTIVSGFGRCGTSLVMQMLEAGGLPMTGEYPSFEVTEANQDFDPDWIASAQGRTIKMLDPQTQKQSLPPGAYRIIWIDRNRKNQAKSQLKLMTIMLGRGAGVGFGRNSQRALSKSYLRDRPRAWLKLSPHGKILRLSFEQLIKQKEITTRLIQKFCDLPREAVEPMMACILTRPIDCAPDMSIELGLIEKSEREKS